MEKTRMISTAKKTNLYKITNQTKSKVYIGLSVSPSKRKTHHKSLLNTNKHYNLEMQRDFNEGDKFNFEVILEGLSMSEAQEKENEYINKARNSQNGVYNSKKDNGYWIASTAPSRNEQEEIRVNQQAKRRALVILEKSCRYDARSIVFEKIDNLTLKVIYSKDRFTIENVYDSDKVIEFFEYLIEKINMINKIEVF